MKKRVGRPPVMGIARSCRVMIRVTSEELALLTRIAESIPGQQGGVATISRNVLLKWADEVDIDAIRAARAALEKEIYK